MTIIHYKNKLLELQRKRDFRGAYEILNEALSEYPANPFFIKNEIYILYKLGRLKEAQQIAEVKLDQFKYDSFFLRTYLNILASLKHNKKELESLIDNVFIWNIRDEDFLIFLVRFTERILGESKALEVSKRAISLLPESLTLKKIIDADKEKISIEGRFNHYKKRFDRKAVKDSIDEIEMILEMPEYKQDYELNLYLAGLYKDAGRLIDAIELYKRLLSIKDNDFTRKMLGYAFYKQGDKSNAFAYLSEQFLKNPFDHYLYTTVFKICEDMKDRQKLEELFKKALGLFPDARHLFGLLKRAEKWQKK